MSTKVVWTWSRERWAALPYILYVRTVSREPRLEPLAWVGLILPIDHPWWATHWPPNGRGCDCSISRITARERARLLASDPEKTGISHTTEISDHP